MLLKSRLFLLRRPINVVLPLCVVAGLVSCAGTGPSKIVNDGNLPSEVTREMREKFEVRDSSLAVPSSVPSPSPIPSTEPEKAIKKKKGRIKKQAGATASAKTSAGGVEKASEKKQPFVIPNRRPSVDPIWLGEKQVYEVTYFGVAAGDFNLQVLPFKTMNGRKVYHSKGTAVSSKLFSLFYRLNDSVESFFDYEGLYSHKLHLILDETKQTRDSLELNDSEKGQTFFWNRWNHKTRGYTEIKEFAPITPFSQDTLSALYYLRTLPLQDGAVFNVPVVSERRNWEAVVTVLRREMINTPMGKKRAIVLKPETKYQGVLKNQGDSFIWLADDDRRFLLRLEAKVRIGTVVAYLKESEPGTPPAPETPPSPVVPLSAGASAGK